MCMHMLLMLLIDGHTFCNHVANITALFGK
jgi:hypothetical protein